MKKISLFSIIEIIISATMLVSESVIWILLMNGFLVGDNEEIADAVGLFFAIIFFAALSILMSVFYVYMIIEGAIVYSGSKKNKTHKILLVVSGIIKLVVCIPSAVVAIIGVSTGFVVCTVSAAFFIVVLCFTAIFGFICSKAPTFDNNVVN